MVNLLVDNSIVRNGDIVLEMIQKRELLGSTGMEHGVAIPHGRTTAASKVVIAFGKSAAGIDFDSIDKKPAKIFFMIIAPPMEANNVYLPILGALVTILKEKSNRTKILNAESFAEFINLIKGEDDND
jgi:PTS system nitrogen regulatory IIA component